MNLLANVIRYFTDCAPTNAGLLLRAAWELAPGLVLVQDLGSEFFYCFDSRWQSLYPLEEIRDPSWRRVDALRYGDFNVVAGARLTESPRQPMTALLTAVALFRPTTTGHEVVLRLTPIDLRGA